MSLAAADLDPYKNISSTPRDVTCGVALPDGQDDYAPGRYRRRYERAATNGAWGYEHGTCGRMTLARREGDTLTVIPALCGTWGCELCGVRRAAWLKQEIGRARTLSGLEWFWTLTICTRTCTPVESFRLVKASWNQVRTDLARADGRFPYVWTVESTKRGYAHLHLLTGLNVEASRLSSMWCHATGGSWIIDVQPVESHRAAIYMAKYCVQQAGYRTTPEGAHLKGQRFFSKSQDVQFAPFKQPGDGDWRTHPAPYWPTAAILRREAPVLDERTQGTPRLELQLGTQFTKDQVLLAQLGG